MVIIYSIKNTINEAIYIGSTKNFSKRKKTHKNSLIKNKHHSIHLQRAWNKYGEENFKFEIIEECEINKRVYREQYYIDTLKPIYNCRKIVDKIDLFHTASTLEEMYGLEKALQIKKKFSLSKKNKPQSNSHIKNRSESKKIWFKIINNNTMEEFKIKGLFDLSNKLKISWYKIYYALKTHNGFIKNLNVNIYKLENLH